MMCRVLHLLREPGEEEVEVLRPSDDVAQVLEDRLQIGCTSASSGTGGRRSARRPGHAATSSVRGSGALGRDERPQ